MDMMDSTYVELGYEKIKGRFVLFGKRLDDFFDISFGSKVYFTAKNRRGSETVEIALEERMPRLEAQADVIKNDFSGELERIGVTGQLPEFIYGASTKYFIDENPYTLCRVNAEDNKKNFGSGKTCRLKQVLGFWNRAQKFYALYEPRSSVAAGLCRCR